MGARQDSIGTAARFVQHRSAVAGVSAPRRPSKSVPAVGQRGWCIREKGSYYDGCRFKKKLA